jgi:hypothetical protein
MSVFFGLFVLPVLEGQVFSLCCLQDGLVARMLFWLVLLVKFVVLEY